MRSSPDSTSRPPINLERVTERTRRQVYDGVAAVFFDRADGGRDGRTYSPAEAELAVYHFAGRWFAVWEDLVAAVELPEETRRQVLRIRESPEPQGWPGRYGLVFDKPKREPKPPEPWADPWTGYWWHSKPVARSLGILEQLGVLVRESGRTTRHPASIRSTSRSRSHR
jgi:hypothetical protein